MSAGFWPCCCFVCSGTDVLDWTGQSAARWCILDIPISPENVGCSQSDDCIDETNWEHTGYFSDCWRCPCRPFGWLSYYTPVERYVECLDEGCPCDISMIVDFDPALIKDPDDNIYCGWASNVWNLPCSFPLGAQYGIAMWVKNGHLYVGGGGIGVFLSDTQPIDLGPFQCSPNNDIIYHVDIDNYVTRCCTADILHITFPSCRD